MLHSFLDDFKPYSEGSDKFLEKYLDFKSRLYTSPLTGHAAFQPPPGEALLTSYYNGGFSEGGNEVYNLEAQFNPSVIDVAKGVRDHMRAVSALGETFSCHDFGCAFGALVYGFQQIGMRATGNEPNENWVKAGNAYCKGALTSKPLTDALARLTYKVDLFTALHVVEHLVAPLEAMTSIKDSLSEEGLVYICVPNGHSIQYVLGGRRRDPNYYFPMHQQYFTAKSMSALLRSAGLEPFYMETRWLPDEKNGADYVFNELFGAPENQLISVDGWKKAICENLLGGELFFLAGHPNNRHAVRMNDLDVKAQKAFDLVEHWSARSKWTPLFAL